MFLDAACQVGQGWASTMEYGVLLREDGGCTTTQRLGAEHLLQQMWNTSRYQKQQGWPIRPSNKPTAQMS